MTADAGLILQGYLIAALKANAPIAALVGPRVFDYAPPASESAKSAVPYILLSEDTRANDTTTDYGGEHDIEINVVSDYKGAKEAKTIIRLIVDLFRTLSPATMTDHRLANLEFQMSDVIVEEGGKRRLGYARWRAVTEEV